MTIDFMIHPAVPVLAIPAVSALFLAFIPSLHAAARLNVFASALTFMATLLLLFFRPDPTDIFITVDLNAPFAVLTAFVAFTTSLFSVGYIEHEVEIGKLTPHRLRHYHAMFQAFVACMLLALLANNIGLIWVAVEGATLATVLLVSLYRTAEAIEAAWKYFLLCGVGIALALFGTLMIYMAGQPVLGSGMPAMTWSAIVPKASAFNVHLLDLSFVFLLVGYGSKAGLAPLHAWLPDAHGEGPTPLSAMLSGLLLNVALCVLLRYKMILASNGSAVAPGPLLMAFGLLSLLFAGIMLYLRRNIKRFFAYSSIEHMGIAAFAFGIGGPIANFAGLLHMALHSLTKSALFFTAGHISLVRETRQIEHLRGLTVTNPVLGWTFVAGMIAIAGLPPFGLFTSEMMLVTATLGQHPLLTIPLVLGLLSGFGALIVLAQRVAFGEPLPGPSVAVRTSLLIPTIIHLGLVLTAGLFLPAVLTVWFQNVAKLLG